MAEGTRTSANLLGRQTSSRAQLVIFGFQMSNTVTLSRQSNQALGLGQFAVDFMAQTHGSGPGAAVLQRTKLFHTDSVLCGLSALALATNAPTVLRVEALEYSVDDPAKGAFCFGSNQTVMAEKAIVANCSAVREWDSNGTNFGYNPSLGHVAGEFGHNDFYPVVIAACQQAGLNGSAALQGMVLLDEIRGRLAEVFSLKTYKIDHVVHGAIASAAAYGALLGASPGQIESAIGMFVAHYIPWRAIRAGKQLGDSKGASAAISAEAAILCMKRSMSGFIGPKDIFRNPEAIFRQFSPTKGDSPFELTLSHSGDDFAVMGMHFKLGLYEHQSAGALQGLLDLILDDPTLLKPGRINSITIRAYEPAFGIIGDPAKRDPQTRQSADHSMVYIVSTMLRKAQANNKLVERSQSTDELWKGLMLLPEDYSPVAVRNPETRKLMERIGFEHGGSEYDAKYPDGIPTSVVIHDSAGQSHDSGLVMYPAGHARNKMADLQSILDHKFKAMAKIAFPDEVDSGEFVDTLGRIDELDSFELATIYDTEIAHRPGFE